MSRLATTVVVGVAVVTLAACQADPPREDDASASPSATGEPSAQPGPSDMGTATSDGSLPDEPGDESSGTKAPFERGYQPAWFEGTEWSCGMSATDLGSVAADHTLDIAGDVTDVAGGEPSHNGDRFLPATLSGPAGTVLVSPPATVWTQDDVVVELPALADAAPEEAAVGERLDAVLGPLSHCVPDGELEGLTTYRTELPAGEYEVRAFVEIEPGGAERQFLLSDPVDVAVTADGIVQR